ncbi:MAG TPA: hypothetical protein VFI65_01180 [Streptosporangiaceae bacterium]|nr:hypothetical protein [Streptosporangiaceae bacterium]
MTAAAALQPERSERSERYVSAPALGRLFWLELRHNAMAWTLPVAIALFWLTTFRKMTALPPFWNLRAATVQTGLVADFVVPVTGAAAWMGAREARRRTADILATVLVPRPARLLMTWAATTCWALVGCAICVGGAYGATAAQTSFGGPLWWPAVVGAGSVCVFAAIGLAAATLLPGRFTAPAVAAGTFFVFALSTELITGSQSAWQVSPLVSSPWDIGPNAGIATFYPFLPDLAIAQLMFMTGLTLAILAALATAPGSGPSLRRAIAAGLAGAGLLIAGTAVTLTGTGRLGPAGLIVIPDLHDVALDRPLPFSPVCSHDAIPVCLNPAYAGYLPKVSAALRPLLTELAGLPGAPVQLSQAAVRYQQGPGNEVMISMALPQTGHRPHVYRFLIPDLNDPGLSTGQIASQVLAETGPDLAAGLAGAGFQADPAQQAVALALLLAARVPAPPGGRGMPPVLTPGSPGYAAATKFAALPPATRRTWLIDHLIALRAGHLTLADLP